MDIIHVSSEMAPFAKVGGLADVITGLSKALIKKGDTVTVYIPKYDCIDLNSIDSLQKMEERVTVTENQESFQNSLWSGKYEGIHVHLVEAHHPKRYFERGKIYGETDDNDRFLYFCKVVSTLLEKTNPSIIHLHDWMTAGCALFLKQHSQIIFTIHNLCHQGRCAPFNLERLGLEINEEELRDPQYSEALNLLRGAILKSDAITTVSPTYREEILTREYGCGLENDLLHSKKKLKGILNGIDTDYWNPRADPFLVKKFTWENVKEGKQENKEHVQKQLLLTPDKYKPLVVAITRLVPQKGPDLILYGIQKTLELGGQFVLLGTNQDSKLEQEFKQFEGDPDVALKFDYNEPLSHLLYGASDMFLMPSIFEPCGLTQMIAMRYGSIPLVRATGGLKDTVIDQKDGFVFEVPDNKGVATVLERAFKVYNTEEWKQLITVAMQKDFSWDVSAEKYLEIYSK